MIAAAPAPSAEPVATERDWPEDFAHENGEYMNTCHACGNTFMGYKRRVTCKVCAAPPSAADALDWTITAPDGRKWHGKTGLKALAACRKDTVDPVQAEANFRASMTAEDLQYERDMLDAKRWRWFREQHWSNGIIAAVSRPKEAVKLGYGCPSEDRLDAIADAAIAQAEGKV